MSRYAKRVLDQVGIIAHSCGLTDPGGFNQSHVTLTDRGVGGFRNSGVG